MIFDHAYTWKDAARILENSKQQNHSSVPTMEAPKASTQRASESAELKNLKADRALCAQRLSEAYERNPADFKAAKQYEKELHALNTKIKQLENEEKKLQKTESTGITR